MAEEHHRGSMSGAMVTPEHSARRDASIVQEIVRGASSRNPILPETLELILPNEIFLYYDL
jgi:hypothetical protein